MSGDRESPPLEVEERPALSLWAAAQCPSQSIRLEAVRGPDGWAVGGMPANAAGTLLVLPDPFTFPSEALLNAGREMTVVGGLASAAGRPGGNRLILGQQVFDDGAVGVLLDPEVKVRTVVSQGCRPIGQPFTITKSEGNIVSEMGGRSAVDRLRETLLSLDEAERALVSKGLHIGIVIDEHKSEFGRGDFLIRGLIRCRRGHRRVGRRRFPRGGDHSSVSGTRCGYSRRRPTRADG